MNSRPRILALALALTLTFPLPFVGGEKAWGQSSTIDATQPATGAALASSPQRSNWVAAKAEIQELMDRDADTTTIGEVLIYSSTDGEKLGADACTIAGGGTNELTCTDGINAGITDASAAALSATQGGAGPSITAIGGEIRINDSSSTGGELHLYEGSSNGTNKVVLAAPASLSADNTITFDSSGLIPVAEVSGAVTGPGSATNNAVVLWNGTGGTAIKDSTSWTVASGAMTGSASTTGTTRVLSVTQASTGEVFRAAKGAAYLLFDDEGTLDVNSASAEPAALFTQLGDGDGINVLQSGSVGNVASMVNGTGEGLAIGNGGTTVLAASDATFQPLIVSQGSSGPIFRALDATSNGALNVLNGGGTTITNDSGSNQAALDVEQDHATADIANLLDGTDGLIIYNTGRAGLAVSDSSGYALAVTQASTGDIFTAVDASANGLVIDTAGRHLMSVNSGNTALTVTNTGIGGLVTAENFLVNADSSVTINSAGASGLLTVTDSDDGLSGLIVDNAGTTTVTGNSIQPAFKSFQNSTGNVLALQTATTSNDPTTSVSQKRVATTDATTTTAFTLADITSMICYLRTEVVASCTGGSCTAGTDGGAQRLDGVFRAPGGTAAQIGATGDVFSEYSNGSYAATYSVTGDDILVRVTGVASHNLTWHVTTWYSCLAG